MSGAAKSTPGTDTPPRYIRWDDEEWSLIERAAAKLGDQVHAPIKPQDFIRGAAKKRAEEVLADVQAA